MRVTFVGGSRAAVRPPTQRLGRARPPSVPLPRRPPRRRGMRRSAVGSHSYGLHSSRNPERDARQLGARIGVKVINLGGCLEPVPVLSSAAITGGLQAYSTCQGLSPDCAFGQPDLRGLPMTLSLRRVLTLSAALLAAALAAPSGSGPGARRSPHRRPVISPEVAADRRVTFRLRAPEAKAVTVSGDFGADAGMRKGEDGVWSATVGPLDPGDVRLLLHRRRRPARPIRATLR